MSWNGGEKLKQSGKMRNFADVLQFKKLDQFMLRQFLPLFAMTFLICTFIVLMQFLWLHLQDLVGKGVGMGVMTELFFYAALSMVPMALPLAVLLAALMTFGNLGESFELTALKAGGVSLFRVMQPLIVLMVFVATGAFFFQNNVLPVAQTKMWTLLKSVRQKTPELDIVEGEFNYQLPNINIYVESKNRDTGMLFGVMIYDFRQGFDRSRVILADSATLRTAPDKTHMYLTLHRGELFENLREGQGGMSNERNRLYRREEFREKLITVAFDVNLEMVDEQDIGKLYTGQNVTQLNRSIDSLQQRIDSIGAQIGNELASQPILNLTPNQIPPDDRVPTARPAASIDPDAARASLPVERRRIVFQSARNSIDRMRMDYLGRSFFAGDEQELLRRTGIELHRRFTLSLACLVFFFIGAPLGAIIRKGGLGTPLVISVFLFIFYYIIDNSGYRLARDGKIPVIEGVWLSSAVLLPLGIFVTYKAVKDSAVFNADSYMRLLRTLTGKNVRALAVKEVVIEDFEPERGLEMLGSLREACADFAARYPRLTGYTAYWRHGIPSAGITALSAGLEHTVSYLSNSRSQGLIDKLNDLPVIENFRILHPTARRRTADFFIWCFPAGLAVWLLSLPWQRRLLKRLKKIDSLIPEIQTILQHEQH